MTNRISCRQMHACWKCCATVSAVYLTFEYRMLRRLWSFTTVVLCAILLYTLVWLHESSVMVNGRLTQWCGHGSGRSRVYQLVAVLQGELTVKLSGFVATGPWCFHSVNQTIAEAFYLCILQHQSRIYYSTKYRKAGSYNICMCVL